MATNIASWRTEKSLTAYPFERGIGIEDFIIDANFVQFDGFIPILASIAVREHDLTLTVTFDTGNQTVDILKTATAGSVYKFYDGTRYLGKLVIGAGSPTMWIKHTEQNLTINVRFLAGLVRAIPSACGVYAVNGVFGAVQFTSDDVISYGVTMNDVVFNAGALNAPAGSAILKTLNGVVPVGNNVTMMDSDLIKVNSNGSDVLISLIDIALLGPILRSANAVVKEQLVTETDEPLITELGEDLVV